MLSLAAPAAPSCRQQPPERLFCIGGRRAAGRQPAVGGGSAGERVEGCWSAGGAAGAFPSPAGAGHLFLARLPSWEAGPGVCIKPSSASPPAPRPPQSLPRATRSPPPHAHIPQGGGERRGLSPPLPCQGPAGCRSWGRVSPGRSRASGSPPHRAPSRPRPWGGPWGRGGSSAGRRGGEGAAALAAAEVPLKGQGGRAGGWGVERRRCNTSGVSSSRRAGERRGEAETAGPMDSPALLLSSVG